MVITLFLALPTLLLAGMHGSLPSSILLERFHYGYSKYYFPFVGFFSVCHDWLDTSLIDPDIAILSHVFAYIICLKQPDMADALLIWFLRSFTGS